MSAVPCTPRAPSAYVAAAALVGQLWRLECGESSHARTLVRVQCTAVQTSGHFFDVVDRVVLVADRADKIGTRNEERVGTLRRRGEAGMLSVSVSIDVPDMERGIRFYTDAFGFSTIAEPYPGVVVLRAGSLTITLLEKREHTKPSPDARDVRHYDRHWTPVHLDIHVDDLVAALDRALKAGARKEQFFENPDHGSAAFCADPFGHGFCLLERRTPDPAE